MTNKINSKKINTELVGLLKLGFSEQESELYKILLNTGRCTVQTLGSKTKFTRTMLYYILKQLISRGLIISNKDRWRTTYMAENPDKLYALLENKELEFEQDRKIIKSSIPNFKKSYSLSGNRIDVKNYDGIVEFEKALEEIIVSKPKEILSFESFYKNKPGLEIRLNHERKRVLRKIKKKVIFAENPESLSALLNIKYNDLTVYNSLPEKKLEIKNTDIILFAGKVLLISYLNKKEPSSILINDSGFYKIQVDLFNSMWQNGTNRTLYYTEKK